AAAVVQALNFVLESATPPRGFKPELIASVEAVDDATVRITATAPDAILPQRLIGASTGILALSAYGADGTVNPMGTGTGPFVLVDEAEGQWIKLDANPSYWGGEVALDSVEVQFIPDGAVRAGMVRTGEADITRNVPIPSVPLIEASDDAVVDRADLPRTTTLYTNNASGPTADLKVRQAISHALDREILALAVLEGAAAPGIGPFPAWEAWTNPDLTAYPYDPDRAIELLAEAGVGEEGIELRLWTYNSRAELPDLAVAIQAMLKDVGITAEVRLAEYSALIDDVKAGEYDLFLLSRGHLVDVYDPSGFLGADYSCEGSFNLSGYCDTEFDAELATTSAMDAEADRYVVYEDLQERIQLDAVSAFVVYLGQIDAHTNRVEGYQIHPLGHYVLTPTLTVSG
ncbi:MAG: ABC transporter substrate-binding protein, partial [Actinomycetota bacterium]|nr:ABC transporter substrate-binding protein [Actinomycetota bacterium]